MMVIPTSDLQLHDVVRVQSTVSTKVFPSKYKVIRIDESPKRIYITYLLSSGNPSSNIFEIGFNQYWKLVARENRHIEIGL